MTTFSAAWLAGHGGYLAGAYGVTLALIVLELAVLARRARASAGRRTTP